MAEFDPIPPKDADEAAFAQALLGDEAGREQRRARLMAALPRQEAAGATPVASTELAWRWQPYAWGLTAAALLLATVLVLRGRQAEPGQSIDPRVAAAPPASTPVVVARAELPPPPAPQAPAAMAPPAAVRIVPAKPDAKLAPPVVVADASLPQRREVAAAVTAAVESAKLAVEPPLPAEPAMAAAPVLVPPAAPVVAAAPAPPPPVMAAKPAVPPSTSNQAETLARADSVTVTGSAARARMSLAASEATAAKPMAPTEPNLLAAANQADLAAARSALQAGASVHQRDAQGRTALMLAARTGSRELVELLLAAGARQADRDAQGWTAADHARDRGHDALAERLR